MDTRKLEAFTETVRCGSINKAAEKLGYTSSGLTYLLNTFETEMGLPLLHRTRNGVSMTPEAARLLPSMKQLLKLEADLYQSIHSAQQKKENILSIGCYSSVAVGLLPSVIQKFSKTHRDVTVDIKIGNTRVISLLENDEIEFAIVDRMMKKDFDWQFLAEDPMCAYVPRTSPLAGKASLNLEDLKSNPLIFPSYESSDFVSSFFESNSLRDNSMLKIDTLSGSDILQFVSQGLGIAVLSHLCAIEAPPDVAVLPIEPAPVRQLGIINKKNRPFAEIESAFIELLKKGLL